MKNKLIRRFTVTLVAVLCMAAFSVTAYAGGADPDPEPGADAHLKNAG